MIVLEILTMQKTILICLKKWSKNISLEIWDIKRDFLLFKGIVTPSVGGNALQVTQVT